MRKLMTFWGRSCACIIAGTVVVGCATASHDERAELLEKPVNCDTADEDIIELAEALPSGSERAKSIFQSVTPVGLATGVLKRENKDKLKVATGKTERDLEGRINEIEQTCGLASTAGETK